MMKAKLFSLAVFLFLTCDLALGQSIAVRFNGLYEHKVGTDTSYYLRLFPSGEIMGILSHGNAIAELTPFFNYENRKKHDSGFFIVEGGSVKGLLTFRKGINRFFEGTIDGTTGDLHLSEYYYDLGEVHKQNSDFLFQKFP
jgi:hypothetical protein